MSNSNTVVYTAIYDGYDVLVDPREPSENVDYICFTDKESLPSDVWEPVYFSQTNLSPNLKNRHVKILPHRHLDEYEKSVYVDGNIQLTGPVENLISQYLSDDKMACPRHPQRSCVYDEAETCIELGKGDPEAIRGQIDRYRAQGFPKNHPISDNSIIFRNHLNRQVVNVMEDWWSELQEGSGRDQLSLPFVAWKNDFEYALIDESARLGSRYFRLHPHRPEGLHGRLWEQWIHVRANWDTNRLYAILYLVARGMNSFRREGARSFARSTSRFLLMKLDDLGMPLLEMADSHGLLSPEFIYAEGYYEKRRNNPLRSDAHAVSEALKAEFEPDSVIDFGCAIGAYLEPFYESGAEVKGIEGNESAFRHAVVPTECLEHHDLREPYQENRYYDLVLSVEVAEHLPERYAEIFVETLANSGETVVMTAAPPGQGGTHHVNEKPREYWITKFEEKGMAYDHATTNKLSKSIQVQKITHVPANLFVFEGY